MHYFADLSVAPDVFQEDCELRLSVDLSSPDGTLPDDDIDVRFEVLTIVFLVLPTRRLPLNLTLPPLLPSYTHGG